MTKDDIQKTTLYAPRWIHEKIGIDVLADKQTGNMKASMNSVIVKILEEHYTKANKKPRA